MKKDIIIPLRQLRKTRLRLHGSTATLEEYCVSCKDWGCFQRLKAPRPCRKAAPRSKYPLQGGYRNGL